MQVQVPYPHFMGLTAPIADLIAHFRCGQARAIECLERQIEQFKRQQWLRQCHRGSVHGNASAARRRVTKGTAAIECEKSSWVEAWGFRWFRCRLNSDSNDIHMKVTWNRGIPPNHPFWIIFMGFVSKEPSIWGYPHEWKPSHTHMA